MKKLKLTALELGATEMLTRAQLGGVSGGGGGLCTDSKVCQVAECCKLYKKSI